MTDPVPLFIFFCILVSADIPVQIIIDRSTSYNPVLRMILICQSVQIITGFFIRYKAPVFYHLFQSLSRTVIDFLGIHIGPVRKLRLRTVYPEERERILLYGFLRFSSVIYIIRKRCDC